MKVGSLVECVKHFSTPMGTWDAKLIPVGDIVTVRDMPIEMGKCGLRFEEVINRKNRLGRELAYPKEWFREVQPPMDLSFIEELQYSEQDKLYH